MPQHEREGQRQLEEGESERWALSSVPGVPGSVVTTTGGNINNPEPVGLGHDGSQRTAEGALTP